jgi:creatinine amidohydrolase
MNEPNGDEHMSQWMAMTWHEVRSQQERNPVIVVPIGCVETQGPYTPVGLELQLAQQLAVEVAARIDGIALPCLPFGHSDTFRNMPGTVFIRPDTLVALYEDVLESVIRAGFTLILCVITHAPNQPLIERAARSVRERTGISVVWVNPGTLAGTMIPEFFDNPTDVRGHGAEPGTSLARYLFGITIPEDADWNKPPAKHAGFDVAGASLQLGGVPIGYPLLWEDLYAENGGFGNPTKGSKQVGMQMFERLVGIIVAVAHTMKSRDCVN